MKTDNLRSRADRIWTLALATGWLCLGLATGVGAQDESPGQSAAEPSGRDIYAARCAECHGDQGEGTAEYQAPLTGELSVDQLAELIQRTMPEDDPESLTEQQAHQVARFVFDGFYSPIAQDRNRPARIALARLSVEAYRQALADLIGGVTGAQWPDEKRFGLQAAYIQGRKIWDRKQIKLERVDSRIDFDFGTESPVDEIDDPHQFSIRWNGSLRVPETGWYRFIVDSPNAVKLMVNSDRPLIDGWVTSENETRREARMFLLGGRVYPLRLEFSKAKQGVDDSKKRKGPPPQRPASIALQWQPPRGAIEPIPDRFLMPRRGAPVFVCSVPFPPDDQSYGWTRTTTISKAWDEATTAGALQVVEFVDEHLDAWVKPGKNEPEETGEAARMRSWCYRFVERAFRHPLSDDERGWYVDRQFAQATTPRQAVARVVLLALKSPRFLFRDLGPRPAWQTAERLAFTLCDSLPDRPLLAAAADGRLDRADGLNQQIERMANRPLARYKLGRFLRNWLQIDGERELVKDPERYPGFDQRAMCDLRTSVELFVDEVIDSPRADYRELIRADSIYLNARLAELFGVTPPEGTGFEKVRLNAEHRAGILTHPYLMAQFAYRSETSPIHRGVFISRKILGQRLKPPPVALAPLAAELHPDLTTRERVALQTRATQCMACHRVINPLGFALEHFDAVGRFRETDRERPIDVNASLVIGGERVTLGGSRDLAEFILSSRRAQTAFCEQMFHFLVGQPVRAYGPTTLSDLRDHFERHEFNIRALSTEIARIVATGGDDSRETR